MKFYDCQPAPSPRRIRICIAEKGLDIPVVQVDLRNGEHLGEAFRKINPQCTVPVLETREGEHLWESVAIYRYLEEIQPDPPLMGTTPLEKAMVTQWDHRIEIEGFYAVAEALRNTAKGMRNRAITGPENYPQIPELAERGRKRAVTFLRVLDDRLGHSRYVAGDFYSVADITGLVVVDFAGWIKLDISEGYPNLKRWHDEVSARPSAKL
ncbi:MAG: glutathione S-transferase [Alphaproteobacteria bacterium]|nr:MAG: glutathione S-transferase [Alphaproteobacteria bacterium]